LYCYRGEPWHRLRQEDFSQVVDLDDSPELFELIREMMRADPERRLTAAEVNTHPVVARAHAMMEQMIASAREAGASVFEASPLGQVPPHFLDDILGRNAMDLSL
jgi:mitosis inhibitor protein kinase SWE1